jgi:hypothetical protein
MAKRGTAEWRARISRGKMRHGDATHSHRAPEYRIWSLIIQRCTNQNNPAYPAYGGRGIKVCRRWMKYTNFITDMGRRPAPHLTVDRIDNDKGYSLKNCRWATRSDQMNNHRRTRRITYRGRTQTLKAWSEETGLRRGLIARRIHDGWDLDRVFHESARRT